MRSTGVMAHGYQASGLKAHASQWVTDHEFMGRFVKSEEVIWLGA